MVALPEQIGFEVGLSKKSDMRYKQKGVPCRTGVRSVQLCQRAIH